MIILITPEIFSFKTAHFIKLDNQFENAYFLNACIFTYTSTVGKSWIIFLVGISSDPLLQRFCG